MKCVSGGITHISIEHINKGDFERNVLHITSVAAQYTRAQYGVRSLLERSSKTQFPMVFKQIWDIYSQWTSETMISPESASITESDSMSTTFDANCI